MGVSVRQRPKGKLRFFVHIRHKGERLAFAYKSEEEASLVAESFRKAQESGALDSVVAMAVQQRAAKQEQAKAAESVPQVPTLKQYFDRFERECLKLTVRESTQEIYSNAFKKHLLPALVPENPEIENSTLRALGEFRLDQLTRSHMKALVSSLLAKKCSRVLTERVENPDGTVTITRKTAEFSLAKPSLRIILSALTTCLTNAQREDGLIPSNPALALGKFIKSAKPLHESIDPFTPSEVPAFLQAIRDAAPDFLTMFIVLIHCGLRSGEAAGLTWADVDFRNKYLVIRQTWTPSGRLEPPKNGKVRQVDLSDAALAALKSHRAKLQKEYLKKDTEEGEEKKKQPEWVFPNQEGNPHSMTNVRKRIFYAALKKAGMHRRPLHSTRHTFASLLLQQGESPVYVKEQCGHSSIKVTVDVYGKFIPGANRQAVNRLPSVDSPISSAAAAGD